MKKISHVWDHIQGTLFPILEERLDPLTESQRQLIATLELVRIEEFVPVRWWSLGRPPADRVALAKAFVAKMVYNLATTSGLIERLKTTPNLRRICGWEGPGSVPSESKFSRAFEDFASSELPSRTHAALINKY